MKPLSNHASALMLLCVSVVISLGACASAPPQTNVITTGTNTAAPNQTPTQEPAAALINGKPIPMSILDREVSRRMDGIRTLGDPLPADPKAFRDTVLDSLIDQRLIEDAAGVQSVVVTPADVEAEVQSNLAIAGSKEKWLAQLAADHMTEAEYREGLHSALLTGKMRDIVTGGVGMTAEQVHARHILVSSEATANEVLAKLKGKADFAALAAQYSQDTSTRESGGDLGWFAKGELLEPTVEDAAFSLQANEISAPVKSKLGYHIIQTLEHVKDRPISPETHYKLAAKVFDAWVQSLEKNAKIEKYPNAQN
ncbi:MAG: peptidylprolyl isomerase [Chloroflexota bacterium]